MGLPARKHLTDRGYARLASRCVSSEADSTGARAIPLRRTGAVRTHIAPARFPDEVRLVWSYVAAAFALLVFLVLAVALLAWRAPSPAGPLGPGTGLSDPMPQCCGIAL